MIYRVTGFGFHSSETNSISELSEAKVQQFPKQQIGVVYVQLSQLCYFGYDDMKTRELDSFW